MTNKLKEAIEVLRGMPEAEQETAGEGVRGLGVRGRHRGRVVLPDVEDPRRDRHRRRRLEEGAGLLDRRARADPDRRVAGRLDLRETVRPVHPPPPDAEPAERGHARKPCKRR